MTNLKIAIVLCILFISCSVFCDESSTDNALSLSLNDAINTAFVNNKAIQIQEQEIKIAKTDIMGVKSAFLPKVNLGGSYTYNDAILTLPKPLSEEMEKDMGVFTGYRHDNKIGLSVNESIYSGGADFARLKQARLNLKIQEETLRARKLDIQFETKRLYYGILLAYETERITQNLYNQALAHYDDVKTKFNQGTSSRFDVLQSKVQVSKIMPELVRSKNSVDLIQADFKKLLGIRMNEPIVLKGDLACSFIEIKEDEFLKDAYANKPEMALKLLGVDITKWSIEYAKAGWMPQVDAAVNYNFRSDDWSDMFNNRHNLWNAGVSVSIPVFDGFSTKAKVDAAKAKYSQAILDKDDLNDQIAVEIRRACLDLKEAEAVINSQNDSIEEAREALRISEISYDNGVGTNLDVLDAQVSLSQIEKNLSEGTYDYLMAKAYLNRTMGKETA